MTTLRLSTMRSTDSELALLREVLSEFGTRSHLAVDLIVLEWETAWSEILDYAIHHDSPDVSLVGTTWVAPLCGMQALRPFTEAESHLFGRSETYLATAWETGRIGQSLWALPWQIDTRTWFYWRPALERAGIREDAAFASYDQIERTVAALTACGQIAVVGPTSVSLNTLHCVATWLWSLGGELMSSSGDCVLFDQPEALEAIERFFRLYLGLARSSLAERCRAGLPEGEADHVFLDRQAAMIQSGPWIVDKVAALGSTALDDLGIAACPGVPYTGGTSLVIWRRSLEEQVAVDLVRGLSGPTIQRKLGSLRGQLPARLDVLSDLSLHGNRFSRELSRTVWRGRALPHHGLWGVVEERLTRTLGGLWRAVLDPATPDVRAVIRESLIRLAAQLNATLGHGRPHQAIA